LFRNLKDAEAKSEYVIEDQIEELYDLFDKIRSINVLPKDIIKNFDHEILPLLKQNLECIKKTNMQMDKWRFY
jgi:hypothetical protein